MRKWCDGCRSSKSYGRCRPGCGDSIPKGRRYWCSRHCSTKALYSAQRQRRQSNRACQACSAQFIGPTNRKYCTRECAKLAAKLQRHQRLWAVEVVPRACLTCGKIWTPTPNNAPRAKFCSSECQRPWYKNLYRARLAGAFIEMVSPDAVYERDGWICQLCNEPIDRSAKSPHPKSPSLDHIVPISRGGDHSYKNCQASHLLCNCTKGNRAWSEAA